jgi:hypothetical protein
MRKTQKYPEKKQIHERRTEAPSQARVKGFQPGVIIYLNKLKDGISKQAIKVCSFLDLLKLPSFPQTMLNEVAQIEPLHIEYQKNTIQGWIRVREPEDATSIQSSYSNNIQKFQDCLGPELQLRILEGEEEKIYWKDLMKKTGQPNRLESREDEKSKKNEKVNPQKKGVKRNAETVMDKNNENTVSTSSTKEGTKHIKFEGD